jgi:hypothetical protein
VVDVLSGVRRVVCYDHNDNRLFDKRNVCLTDIVSKDMGRIRLLHRLPDRNRDRAGFWSREFGGYLGEFSF